MAPPKERAPKRKQEEEKSLSKVPKVEETSKNYDELPENTLIMMLTKLPDDVLEEECKKSQRVDQLFHSHESDFNPPDLGGRNQMEFSYRTDREGAACLEVKIVSHAKNAPPAIISKNPSVEWIKRRLKGVKSVSIELDGPTPGYFQKENEEYGKMKHLLESMCEIQKATIIIVDSPIVDIVALFPDTTRIEISTLFGEWRNQNLFSFSKRISALNRLTGLTAREANRFLENDKLDKVNIGVREFFTLFPFIEQWKNGTREIQSWHITTPTEFDFELGHETFLRTVEGVEQKMLVIVQEENLQMRASFYVHIAPY